MDLVEHRKRKILLLSRASSRNSNICHRIRKVFARQFYVLNCESETKVGDN
jgi:hypothetical protein